MALGLAVTRCWSRPPSKRPIFALAQRADDRVSGSVVLRLRISYTHAHIQADSGLQTGVSSGVNGIHDMGGVDGFGPVVRERNEPAFNFDWERRVFGMLLLAGRAAGNTDEFRHALERIPAPRYVNTTYYERWIDALEILLIEKGVVSHRELAARGVEPATASQPANRFQGTPSKSSRARARFQVGDGVIARNLNPSGHTRLARYVRAKRGVIRHDWGAYVFPDSNAHGSGTRAQHVYSVAFKARELWGNDAHPRDTIHIDLWEDYLIAAETPVGKKPAAFATGRGRKR
jgi:nitrile hydratase subunit beta